MRYNKKGTEKYISLWWILVLIIIGIGIVAGVWIFFGANTDVREYEASILNERIHDCLFQSTFTDNSFMDNDFDVIKMCKFNNNINPNGNFYVKIIIKNESGRNIRELKYGNLLHEEDCKLSISAKKADKYPKCIQKNITIMDNDGIFNVEVLTSSNQFGRKNG